MMPAKPNFSFYLTMFAIIIVTMLMHELTHVMVGTALG